MEFQRAWMDIKWMKEITGDLKGFMGLKGYERDVRGFKGVSASWMFFLGILRYLMGI